MGVRVIGKLATSPATAETTAGAAAMEKFAVGELTSKVSGRVYVEVLLVPIMLSAYDPEAVRLLAVNVSVEVPAPVTVDGLKP